MACIYDTACPCGTVVMTSMNGTADMAGPVCTCDIVDLGDTNSTGATVDITGSYSGIGGMAVWYRKCITCK